MNEVSILIGGILTLFMSLFHMRFYKLFGWKNQLSQLHQVQYKIIYTIHLALTIIFFLLGVVILVNISEIAAGKGLALWFNLLLSIFWLWRLVWQVLYYKSRARLHIFMIIWFFLLALSFILPTINLIFK